MKTDLVLDRYKITYGRGYVKAGRSFSEINLDSKQTFTSKNAVSELASRLEEMNVVKGRGCGP